LGENGARRIPDGMEGSTEGNGSPACALKAARFASDATAALRAGNWSVWDDPPRDGCVPIFRPPATVLYHIQPGPFLASGTLCSNVLRAERDIALDFDAIRDDQGNELYGSGGQRCVRIPEMRGAYEAAKCYHESLPAGVLGLDSDVLVQSRRGAVVGDPFLTRRAGAAGAAGGPNYRNGTLDCSLVKRHRDAALDDRRTKSDGIHDRARMRRLQRGRAHAPASTG
jgi:hypothetical protein